MKPNLMTLLSAILIALTACPLRGQGVGTPSGTGEVPRISFDHLEVNQPNAFRLAGCTPGAPIFLFVAHTALPVPLAPFGFGPAVLGPDLNSPLGAATILNLMADANGELSLPNVVPAAVAHLETHVQAASLDAAAPFGGVAFSEHRAFIFGFEREKRVVAGDSIPGFEFLAEVFPYGAVAAPLDPRLTVVTFVDLVTTNDNEMAFGRRDRPVLDRFDDLADAVRLADGSSLLFVRSSTFEDGIVRVSRDRGLEVLVWAQGTAACPILCPEIAVSAFGPFAAILAEDPLPQFGGATLLLARTDGRNVLGSHAKVIAIPTPAGLDVESCSLCFLNGALFYGDGATLLRRYDLATGVTTPVVFPPSANQVPVYLDETCAPALDGSALAIGAGASETSHDIYIVTAGGSATNLSNQPGDYEDPGPGDPTGMQLVMSATGDRVAYMRTVIETETFVGNVAASESHVTNAQQYINSIDTVTGLGFSVSGRLILSAGQNLANVDAYGALIPPAGGPVMSILNHSVTSGTMAPPFGLGATLELTRRFTSGTSTFLEFNNQPGPRRLQVIDDNGSTAAFDVGVIESILPATGACVVADKTSTNAIRIRSISNGPMPSMTSSYVSGGAATIAAKGANSFGGGAYLVHDGLLTTLVLVDLAGTVSSHPGPVGAPTSSLAFDETGRVLVITSNATGFVTAERFDPITQAWTAASGAIPAPVSVRFVR